MEEGITPTKTFLRVSTFPENICLQCGGSVENAALRRRLFSGSTKTKTCQNLEVLLGDLFEVGKQIVCRNCAERNETLSKKIFNVRENFERTKRSVKVQGSVCVKRLTKEEHKLKEIEGAENEGKATTSKRRALFHASVSLVEKEITDAEPKPLLLKRDSYTQMEPERYPEEIVLSSCVDVSIKYSRRIAFVISQLCS